MESNIIQTRSKVDNGERDKMMGFDLNNNLHLYPVPAATSSSPPSVDSRTSMIGPKIKVRGRPCGTFTGDSEDSVTVKRFKGGKGDRDGINRERQESQGYSKAAQPSSVTSSASASVSTSTSKPKPPLDVTKIIKTYEHLGEDQTGLNFVDFFNAGVSVSVDFNFNLEEELAKTIESGDFDWIGDAAEIDKKCRFEKRKADILNQKW